MLSASEAAIEAELKTKGLNAPRLTPADIDATIVGEDYHVFAGTTVTVCALKLQRLCCDRRKHRCLPGKLRCRDWPAGRARRSPQQDLGARGLLAPFETLSRLDAGEPSTQTWPLVADRRPLFISATML